MSGEGTLSGPSLGRTALVVFGVHVAVTLVLAYVVVPQFDTMTEPPAALPADANVLRPLVRIFYFPIVSWAHSSLATGSRPGIGFVVANSAVVALVIAVVWRMASRFQRAVAYRDRSAL